MRGIMRGEDSGRLRGWVKCSRRQLFFRLKDMVGNIYELRLSKNR